MKTCNGCPQPTSCRARFLDNPSQYICRNIKERYETAQADTSGAYDDMVIRTLTTHFIPVWETKATDSMGSYESSCCSSDSSCSYGD